MEGQLSPSGEETNKKQGGDDRRRYVPYSQRQCRTDIPEAFFRPLHYGKYHTFWRGTHILKSPFDVAIYGQLIWELRPRTVIQMDPCCDGGTSVWMADLLKVYDIDCHVFVISDNSEVIQDNVEMYKNITLLDRVPRSVDKTLSPDMLRSVPHPWLVIVNPSTDAKNCLDYIHSYTNIGDYIVVEGTNTALHPPGQSSATGHPPEPGVPSQERPYLTQFEDFISQHDTEYGVDRLYCDMFGHNATENMNSYLKRCQLDGTP